MGNFFRYLPDLAGLIAIIFAQIELGRMLMTYAARRWSPGVAAFIPYGLAGSAFGLCFGFLLNIPRISDFFALPSALSGTLCGTAYLWAFSSTGSYYIYRCLKFFESRSFDPARRRLINSAGGALIAAPFALAGFGVLIERTDFQVREVDIPISDLPNDLEGLRLVQLSDIHLSPYLTEKEFARAIDAANGLRAQVALVTGDLISMRGDPLDACLRQLSRLRADSGILGCLGNHEIYADAQQYTTEEGARRGIRFLRNQNYHLRFGTGILNFAGVDYQRISMKPDYLQGAERLIEPGTVNILLSHNPDVFPVAVNKGYDLTISGHTHGGQVTVEILHQTLNIARFFTRFVYGPYYTHRGGKTSSVYVTRGIGTIGIPARIGAPPEIALLRLRKA